MASPTPAPPTPSRPSRRRQLAVGAGLLAVVAGVLVTGGALRRDLAARGGTATADADAGYEWHGTPLPEPRPAPALALADGSGRRFDLAAERGKVVLVFFGYTQCPDVCPTTLADWSRARAALGADTARVRFVFVSVDPDRDSPAAATAYARRFDPGFTGLSGTPGEVGLVTSQWGVGVMEEPAPGDSTADPHAGHAGAGAGGPQGPGTTPSGRTLAHTARTFVVDPAGRLTMLFGQGTAPADLAADVRQLLD